MTNRQSNIIFYTIIFTITFGLVINHFHPDFFTDINKSQEQLAIKEALKTADYQKALANYEILIDKRISSGDNHSIELANLYESAADIYALTKDKTTHKEYYLKSLAIKQQLKDVGIFSFAHTYYQLANIAFEAAQYDQAQHYFELALSKRLDLQQTVTPQEDKDPGLFLSMQQSRLDYLRTNNEGTIATFEKLAQIHSLKQEFSIAEQYYRKALAASEATFGKDDIKTLKIAESLKALSATASAD